ncbi:MAG: hypothetical protein MUE50_12640 [Pirellulaceae bacterium]|nr:hypothetical protein [Pirellulaceae bacterium]
MKPVLESVVVSVLALIVCVPAAGSEAAFAWQGSDIGGGQPTGSHTWDGQTLTVSGAGAGLNVKHADQLHFAHVGRPAGDFEVVVRLRDFSGEGDARAGIMARADGSASAAMAAVSFQTKDNGLSWISRIPGAGPPQPPRLFAGGINLANKPPLWLRMVRLSKNFAVYKSRDGRLWSMISNVSGGPLAIDGPVQLGVFVSSGVEGKTVTAAFDSIAIGAPRMRYKTSWVGNTFGSREEDKHVSNAISAMWVALDGTCYTSSYWDEGGRPVTSYRAGRAARGLPIGTPQTAEGAITGDATHLFVAAVDRIIQLDPAQPDFAPRPLCLSVNLLDKKKNHSIVSGLASDGRQLFVADSRENLIRVVAVAPDLAPKQYHVAQAANDGVILAPQPVVVPEGDARLAPAVVYQTQRGGEGNRYTLPGFTPGREYAVRGHFVEYVDRPANCDPRNRFVVFNGVDVRVAELAGGVLKPLAKDLPGAKADAGGNVIVTHGAYGGPGICGFEILDADGKRLFAINCGGPPVGDFQGECPEQVDRAFAFERPGPMAVDKRGDLWIIQRGNDFPIGGLPAAKYKAAVRCHKPDGTFTGREITDVVNPRALGYDPANDRLLVGENGPDLNVRIYASLDSRPVLAKTFGEKGGVYAGRKPGLVNDPSAGGAARFAGISGVGVDERGNLYVGGGFQGSDLRMFTPEGKLGWMVNSLMFCNTYDVDPASDGAELYGTYNHLQLDLTQTEPGREQRYVGSNWDLRHFGEPDRAGSSQAVVRRLGPEKRLTMFTSGQGNIGDIKIFRYDDELAIPAGGTRDHGNVLWIDANGNGRDEPAELTKMASAIGWITGLCVDTKGDLWAANATTGGCFMRHFFFQGLTAKGVPVYSGVKDEGFEDIRFPEEGDRTNAWGMACRMDYDADRDILVACYPAVPRKGEGDTSPAQYFLGRYDDWSKGHRAPCWKQRALEPQVNPDFFMYEKNLFPYRGYMGLQIAGDYVFFAYLFGEVHVFDLATGKLVEILALGPEVNGQSAWEDAAMGLRAFRRKNGEYLIFTENSGWGGKNNLFRWKP